MTQRDRAWRRKKNYSKGRRKKHIAIEAQGVCWYKHDGQYIKGKIHCSCPACTMKTNNRKGYGQGVNYTHSDRMKVESMGSQFSDYKNEQCENYKENGR